MNYLAKKTPYFVSWSGGKDSCLSLFRAIKKYGMPQCLLNMLTEDGIRSRSHGLLRNILEQQASLLKIPIQFYATTWQHYEATFRQALDELKNTGIKMGVFGDIKISADPNWSTHRQWADKICSEANILSDEPLWEDKVENILQEFIEVGFIAKIIAINANCLSADYLGRILDKDLITELIAQGVNPAGEKGEYHTIVVDGPLFTHALCLKEKGRVLKDGYWFLDVI